MKAYAKDLLAYIVGEIGYHEKATNANLESKTENSGSKNYNKYAYFIDTNYPEFYNGKKNGYAWCDVFVDASFIKVFGLAKAMELLCQPTKSLGAGCTFSYRYYKQKGQVGKEPKVCAQIFFGKDENNLTHTGIVEKFDADYVYTIEGNTADQVARRSYSRNSKDIFGYGYPKYDEEPVEVGSIIPTPDTPINKSGSVSKTVKWYGKVVGCTNLNVRKWAGVQYARLNSIPSIHADTVVGICDAVKAQNGVKWYYVVINGNTYGFVCSAYIAAIKTDNPEETTKVDENSDVPAKDTTDVPTDDSGKYSTT